MLYASLLKSEALTFLNSRCTIFYDAFQSVKHITFSFGRWMLVSSMHKGVMTALRINKRMWSVLILRFGNRWECGHFAS